MPNRRFTFAAPLRPGLALSAILVMTGSLCAQAGGGGSYGSGGGGGSGGDGGGIFELFYWLMRLCIEKPALGIPLTIAAIIVLAIAHRSSQRALQSRAIRRGRRARTMHWTQASTEALQAVDPEFRTDVFLKRVEAAFHTAQDSWCKQDLRPLRAFVSDAIYERFSLQIEEQIEDGWRQGMDDVRVDSIAIIHHGSDRHFDTLTVRIPFSAKIYRRGRESGEVLPGSELPEREFTECWSFLRRRGANTREGAGLLEQRCPNCGASLEIEEAGKCGNCESLIRSGEYDWILVEITQAIEWQGEDSTAVPGLAAAQAVDPDLNAQHLEDRASVIFWRKVAADRDGVVARLTKVALPEYCTAYASRLALRDGGRHFVGNCAVGSVKTLGILPGAEWDRAVIEVRWDGVSCTVSESGTTHCSDERRPVRSLFVLTRRAGVQTDLGHSTSSSHCASCGAPDEGGTDHACSYCDAVLNDGSTDWLLADFVPSYNARGLLAEIAALPPTEVASATAPPPRPATSDTIQWIVHLALQDGDLDAADRAVLDAAAKKWEVPKRRMDDLVAAARGDGKERVGPTSRSEAQVWTEHLLELSLSDGHLTRGERRLISRASLGAGFTLAEVRSMTRSIRKRMAKESRRAMRAERKGRSAARKR